MYAKLTPQWAGTLLGLLELALVPIPFVFYKWGAQIRMKSPLIRQLREDQEKSERRAARQNKLHDRRDVQMAERGEAILSTEAAEK